MYTIRKKFKFEMAHMLGDSYSQECQNIHGHSYVLEVKVISSNLNKDGMVIDFKRLKEIVMPVVDLFDHALVLPEPLPHLVANPIAHQKMIDAICANRGRICLVEYNPTAELMVKDIHSKILPDIDGEVRSLVSLEVKLHETDTGYASYSGWR